MGQSRGSQSKPSLWSKVMEGENAQWQKDEILDAVYWISQILAVIIGISYGFAGFQGMYGILSFVAIKVMGTMFFYRNVLRIDEEEFGGNMEIQNDSLMPSLAMFMLCWIITFTVVNH